MPRAGGGDKAELNQARNEATELRQQLAAAETAKDAAQASEMQLGSDLAAAETARDAAQASVMQLGSALAAAEMARDAAQASIMGLTTDLGQANTNLMDAQNALQTAIDEGVVDDQKIDQLTQDVTAAEGARVAVQDRLNTANSDLMTAKSTLTTVRAELNTANSDLMTAKSTLTTVRAELNTATAVSGGFATAQNARDDATAAARAAAKAVTDATAASMKITARAPGVAGDSGKAQENAQAVLDARDRAKDAVTRAKNALMDAEIAWDAVDVAVENGGPLKRALEAAIKAAELQLAAARLSAGSTELKAAVAAVEGSDSAAEGYPRNAAGVGRAVALDIAGSLIPYDVNDGQRKRGLHQEYAPDQPGNDAIRDDDRQGRTWAEIAGTVVDVTQDPEADPGDLSSSVKASSADGIALSSITANPPSPGDVDDGEKFTSASLKGIPGTVFCAGNDCRVEGDAGSEKLTGRWYFTPDSFTQRYVRVANVFVPETLYAKFGHWLTADQDGNTEVNTYAFTDANTSGLDLTTDTLTDTSATYEGRAVGMSVKKATDSDGNITSIESGAFSAKVTLKATFDGAVKSCWPMACLYRSLRFGEEYLPVSALLVDKT